MQISCIDSFVLATKLKKTPTAEESKHHRPKQDHISVTTTKTKLKAQLNFLTNEEGKSVTTVLKATHSKKKSPFTSLYGGRLAPKNFCLTKHVAIWPRRSSSDEANALAAATSSKSEEDTAVSMTIQDIPSQIPTLNLGTNRSSHVANLIPEN